jgi:type IV pilus assembly protein PilV
MLMMARLATLAPVGQKRQKGSSLLEVLIAVLIMSFGLLALGGLAAAAQQYVKMAQFQSVGMALASDLGERMRGNVAGFQSGGYVRASAYSTVTVTVPSCANDTACTVAEMAAKDMAEWVNELQGRLPGGDAYVQRDPKNTLATDIWILWIDPSTSELSVAANTDCPATAVKGLAPTPRCMYYRISL